jgi:peptide/nickel transport system ATP-binding protein
MKRSAVYDRVIELLTLVGIPEPARRYRQFPLEFSGGMRQRAMIAIAIANEPSLLIADEPTTALDVTIQAQVMEVLTEVRERTGAAMVLITHDLGLVAELADRVAVMYAGRIMESAEVRALFHAPRHPYSMGLLASQPGLGSASSELYAIPGQPPDVQRRPAGCVFSPRCEMRAGRAVCTEAAPPLNDLGDDHKVACHFAEEAANWRQRATAPQMSLPHA